MCDRDVTNISGYWIVKTSGISNDGVDSKDCADSSNVIVYTVVYKIKQQGRFLRIKQLAIIQTAPERRVLSPNRITLLGILRNNLGRCKCSRDSTQESLNIVDSTNNGTFDLNIIEYDGNIFLDGVYLTPGIVRENTVIQNANVFESRWKRVSGDKAKHVVNEIQKCL